MTTPRLQGAFDGGEHNLFLVAGPCVLEDRALNLRVAREVRRVAEATGVPVVFKASFDKANRSSGAAGRGPGIAAGLERLREVREETGLRLLTDVHEADQCALVAEAVDVLQIPAFLCRQTDLLRAAGATGRAVNVKKGQWMAPEEMRGAVEKVRGAGAAEVALTERGTAFGYGNLVVDMRSIQIMREVGGVPVVFDGTHSVQRPGLAGGASGGDPRFIPPLVRAAVAAGADGLFLEVHPDPASAPSDAASMLRLEALEPLVLEALAIRSALAGLPGVGRG